MAPPLAPPSKPPGMNIGGQRPVTKPPLMMTNPSGKGMILPATLSSFIQGDAPTKGNQITVIGVPGIGKSTFCAQFPGVFFICDELETGILDLIAAGNVPIDRSQVAVSKTMAETKLILTELANVPNNVQTVVYESYTTLERAIMAEACSTRWKGDWGKGGFMNYQEGPRSCAARDVPEIMQMFQKLLMQGKHVLISGHTAVKQAGNAEGADYYAEVPFAVSKDMWAQFEAWCGNIIYLVYQVNVEKIGGKDKATGGSPTMICHQTGGYRSKNKFGISTYLPLDGLSPRERYLKLCEAGRLDPLTFRNK